MGLTLLAMKSSPDSVITSSMFFLSYTAYLDKKNYTIRRVALLPSH